MPLQARIDGAYQMNADKIAEKAMSKVTAAIGADLTESQLDQVRRILSDLTIEIAGDTAQHCCEQAAKRYQTGLAADIADEIKRSKVALITNLQSMR